MKKLYVIVGYDLKGVGYLSYAVDGLIFKDKKSAEEYRSKMPLNYSTRVEELILYEVD